MLSGVAHRRTGQPILIDADPIDTQEQSTCHEGPTNQKIRNSISQDIHDFTGDSTQSRWMTPMPSPKLSLTPRLSLQRLGAYNDILTDTLIDGVSFPSIYQTKYVHL